MAALMASQLAILHNTNFSKIGRVERLLSNIWKERK